MCRMREEEARLDAQDKEKSKARKQANVDRKEWLDKRGARLASWKDFNKSVRTCGCQAGHALGCALLALVVHVCSIPARARLMHSRLLRLIRVGNCAQCCALLLTGQHESQRQVPLQGKKHTATKAPTIKTGDAERSYVQRATTEQFVGNYKKRPPK